MGFVTSLNALVNVIVYSTPFEKRFCRGNTALLDSSDGFNICTTQAFTYVYMGLACAVCWMCQSIDLFLKVGLGMRSTSQYTVVFIILVFSLPLISAIYLAQSGSYGYLPGNSSCWVDLDHDLDIYIWFLPIIGITAVGLSCMVVVLFRILQSFLRTVGSKGSNVAGGLVQNISMFRTPILFIISFLTFFLSIVAYRAGLWVAKDSINNGFTDWVGCVFSHYDGVSDHSWQQICGIHTSVRVSKELYMWAFVCITGEALLISVVYLSSSAVVRLWLDWAIALLRYKYKKVKASVLVHPKGPQGGLFGVANGAAASTAAVAPILVHQMVDSGSPHRSNEVHTFSSVQKFDAS